MSLQKAPSQHIIIIVFLYDQSTTALDLMCLGGFVALFYLFFLFLLWRFF